MAPTNDPAGYAFAYWTVNGTEQTTGKNITFTMPATLTKAVAEYTPINYPLTVQSTPPTGVGIVSISGDGGTTDYTVSGGVAYGTLVELAAPVTGGPVGYSFEHWTVNGTPQTTGKTITFRMPEKAVTAEAVYTANIYTLDVSALSTNPGDLALTGVNISSSIGGEGGPTDYSRSVAYEGTVNLVAPTNDPAGYAFAYWTVNGTEQTTGKNITFTMPATLTKAVAEYTPINYPLTVQSTPPTGVGIVSISGDGGTTDYTVSGGVAYGTLVELAAPVTGARSGTASSTGR